MTRFNFFLCHRVHRQSCRTHFHGFLQRILRITSSKMPNVRQNTFLGFVRYVIIFHMTCSIVYLKRDPQVFTTLNRWVRLPHKESWICHVTRQSFQGSKSHLLLPFLPTLAYPLEKYKKVQVTPRTLGKYLTARCSCLILIKKEKEKKKKDAK